MDNLKQIQEKIDNDSFVLKNMQKISGQESICLELKELCSNVDNDSGVHYKACLSILVACLNQRRGYFLLSRKILLDIIKNNQNFPAKQRTAFSPKEYKFILATLINDYKIMECITLGNKRQANVYKLTHFETLNYIISKGVNIQDQKEKIMQFFNKKAKKVLK